MPLLRRWSARSAEAREVLVRFQRVALVTPEKPRGVALLFQRSNSQPRSSSRSRATSFGAYKLGWFNSNFRRDAIYNSRCESTCVWRSLFFEIFWAKMLHGGALEYGSSKQPTTTLAAFTRGIRCVSTSKSVRLRPSPPIASVAKQ